MEMLLDSNDEDIRTDNDESMLISRAQSGDGQAFRVLIEPHLQHMYRVAVQITRNHEDAEDACQNGMMKAFVHLRTFQRNARFSTWLTRIVINEALMMFRKIQTEARHRITGNDVSESPLLLQIADQNSSSDPEAMCCHSEQKTLLWEAINQLGQRSRAAICQIGLEDARTRDFAEQSELSRSGVSSRLQRGLRQLRTMLEIKFRTRKERIPGLA